MLLDSSKSRRIEGLEPGVALRAQRFDLGGGAGFDVGAHGFSVGALPGDESLDGGVVRMAGSVNRWGCSDGCGLG